MLSLVPICLRYLQYRYAFVFFSTGKSYAINLRKHVRCSHGVCSPIALRHVWLHFRSNVTPYAMSGPRIAYTVRGAMQCPVLTARVLVYAYARTVRCPVLTERVWWYQLQQHLDQLGHSLVQISDRRDGRCCAMPGTDKAYALSPYVIRGTELLAYYALAV